MPSIPLPPEHHAAPTSRATRLARVDEAGRQPPHRASMRKRPDLGDGAGLVQFAIHWLRDG